MTVVVERPINLVFEFCRDFENFPQITDVLLSVEDTQDGRSHWSVRSPTGQTIGWDAVVTKYVPNSVIAWESVPGSVVLASGLMRFSPLSPNETRVDLNLTYRPLRTNFLDAIRALVLPTNTARLRQEVALASQQMGVSLGRADLTSSPSPDRPSVVPHADAPESQPPALEERHWDEPPADETRADPETAP
jgi:Polyketide cyclase / dehydrase and lipid transport